jgi:uncharacterized protein (DUF736 family)
MFWEFGLLDLISFFSSLKETTMSNSATSTATSTMTTLKAAALALANVNLFANVNAKVQFFKAKDDAVVADYTAFDKEKGYDIKGINTSGGNGVKYIRLSIAVDVDGKRQYLNGALFPEASKKSEKAPDFSGVINFDDKSTLRLAAWNKTGEKAGSYLSLAITEPRPKTEGAPAAEHAEGSSEPTAEQKTAMAGDGLPA